MRRRFGRRRRGGETGRSSPIESSWLERLVEAGTPAATRLEPIEDPAIPAGYALIGEGEDEAGARLLVSFSPRDAGDALLAVLAHASGREPAFEGKVYVVAPVWSAAARRRLALAERARVSFVPLAAPSLAEDPRVVADPRDERSVGDVGRLAQQIADPASRILFSRAADGLAGLAAKHGGVVRASADALELVLLARRVASLRVGGDALELEVVEARSTQPLQDSSLAELLDRLEGAVRKRARDGRVAKGEDGLRGRALTALVDSLGLRDVHAWPLPGTSEEVIDLAAVDAQGRPVVAAVRESFTLVGLGRVLDAWLSLRPQLPLLLSEAAPPVRWRDARLVLAAQNVSDAVRRALGALDVDGECLQLGGGRELEVIGLDAAPGVETDTAVERDEEPRPETPRSDARRRGRRRRGGRGRGRGDREGAPDSSAEAPAAAADDTAEGAAAPGTGSKPRFAQMSTLDLDDDFGLGSNESGGRRRRRRRPRGGGRRRDGGDDERGGLDQTEAADDAGDGFEAGGDESAEDGPAAELARLQDEREMRRLARLAKVDPEPEAEAEPEAEPEPERPQRPRRAAIVARADRDSLGAALLLAREARQLEGLWVYPQDELMTFFRSVATDLRDEVVMYVVGFQPSPVRDVVQAASLYSGRLVWYDVHEWPPEDLEPMRDAIGSESLRHHPGLRSVLPLVLEDCSRRSRFSDKLVDLVTARFSEHDYRRWGSLWWWRLGELTGSSGEKRSEIQPLLTGRPSELAAEARKAAPPPTPAEVEHVSSRDFRLVHFGGFTLALVPSPPELDLHLLGRIARGRYGAELSLGWYEGEEVLVLATDDTAAARPLDVGSMAQHLADKLDWVEELPGHDHVARVRVRGLAGDPERADAVVSEIAMGRSILEG